jgi:hypothetical protein
MQLNKPTTPLVSDVREHRHPVNEIKAVVGQGQRRRFPADEKAERRRERGGRPSNALGMNVAAYELSSVGFLEEHRHRPAGPAAKVEHRLSIE